MWMFLLSSGKQVKKLVDEKFNKYIEITHMYQEQIKEIKAQLTEIEDGSPHFKEISKRMSLKQILHFYY